MGTRGHWLAHIDINWLALTLIGTNWHILIGIRRLAHGKIGMGGHTLALTDRLAQQLVMWCVYVCVRVYMCVVCVFLSLSLSFLSEK